MTPVDGSPRTKRMKLRISTLSAEPKQFDFAIPVKDVVAHLPPKDRWRDAITEPLDAHLIATKMNRNIFVDSSSNIQLHPHCDRCLEQYHMPFDLYFYATCVPKTTTLNEEDEGVFTYEYDEIDLLEIFRDQLFSSLPMVFLCKEDCAGLCPSCGANLNLGACDCPQ